MLNIKIINGYVYDGSGNPWTKLDVGIKNDVITKIGNLANESSEITIDAKNMAIAPGFIDTHVHSDLLCIYPEIHKVKALQGVTTELLGQDGISVAPISEETKPLWQKQLKALNGDIGEWPWTSVKEYLGFLENSNIINNSLYLVPHGNIRSLVMGFEGRTATNKEAIKMRKLVEKGMKEGAVGFSSGLVYPPALYSDTEEIIEICKGVAKYNGCFVVHIRDESKRALEAWDEMIDVAEQTGVRLHISHFKIAGKVNRDKYKKALNKLDSAREKGIEVTFDQYPYTAGATVLDRILPPWVYQGGAENVIKRLKNKKDREKVINDLKYNENYENRALFCGWENIIISTVSTKKNKELENRSILEIANLKNTTPEDAAINILIEEELNVSMINHWGEEEDIIYGMQHPAQMVGTDGIFGSKPHPRLYGTYPKILGRYVREMKVLSLSEAIRRMTSAPAQLLRLNDRGLLKEGFKADIVVFNPDTIIDKATYQEPNQDSKGIEHVIINGELTVHNSLYTDKKPGKVIRQYNGI